MFIFLSISIANLFAFSFASKCEVHGGRQQLICEDLTDADLPLTGYAGHYDEAIFVSNNFTRLTPDCFRGISSNEFTLAENDYLKSIEFGFLGGSPDKIRVFKVENNPILTDFSFLYMQQFRGLHEFSITGSGLWKIPTDIIWPEKLHSIDLSYNEKLEVIEPYAFLSATGLKALYLIGSGDNLVVQTNGFYTKSKLPKDLHISSKDPDSPIENLMLLPNAFGNVEGGELWNGLYIATSDFPEDVFRIMLKTHFDKGHFDLFNSTNGQARVSTCQNCDIAWLYKDARMFGMKQYLGLVGEDNVLCPNEIGPVITSNDWDFVQLMESCPNTDMPWPGPNVCEDLNNPNQDDVQDPENCQCFYLCDGGIIHGHECCQPGLVFNPNSLTCDWPYNVPDCNII